MSDATLRECPWCGGYAFGMSGSCVHCLLLPLDTPKYFEWSRDPMFVNQMNCHVNGFRVGYVHSSHKTKHSPNCFIGKAVGHHGTFQKFDMAQVVVEQAFDGWLSEVNRQRANSLTPTEEKEL